MTARRVSCFWNCKYLWWTPIDGNVFLHSLWQGWDENIIIYKQLFDHYRKQWYQYENTIQGKINKIVHVISAATRYQANVEHVLYVYINNRRVTFVRIVSIKINYYNPYSGLRFTCSSKHNSFMHSWSSLSLKITHPLK
jgi:hypothetical protein